MLITINNRKYDLDLEAALDAKVLKEIRVFQIGDVFGKGELRVVLVSAQYPDQSGGKFRFIGNNGSLGFYSDPPKNQEEMAEWVIFSGFKYLGNIKELLAKFGK